MRGLASIVAGRRTKWLILVVWIIAAVAMSPLGSKLSDVTTDDTEALRATGQYRMLTPDDLVAEIREKGEYGFTLFHPLVGGVPPAMGWESMHLFEHEVLPRLTAS